MEKQIPSILYDYVHLWLKPDEGFVLPEDWRESCKDGKLSSAGTLDLLIEENYYLQVQGISIPTSFMGLISKPENVVQAVRNLVGDLGEGLARCVKLVEQRVLQDTLYFTPLGLADYTHNFNSPNGDNVSSWIKYASSIKSELRDYFPRDFSLPIGSQIKFVPTFEKLKSMEGTIAKGPVDLYSFTGKTFADRINNFLGAYDAVKAHENWIDAEERRLRNKGRGRKMSSSERDYDPKIAEVKLLVNDGFL